LAGGDGIHPWAPENLRKSVIILDWFFTMN
jgi:hypothetical protein